MPVTYSVNIGQTTEASRKPSVYSVLQDLPNNTQKLISPKDVRDAFLSAWANSSFRVTTPGNLSTNEYIGIDSGNPSSRDIKNKIFIGKRQFGNLDIMNTTLLNSDTDVFFYNTKSDSVTQSSTKISILAGTNSSLYPYAPYIESKVNASGTGFDFNIHNNSLFDAPINVFSLSGRVAINNVVFPTVAETAASASNGKILRYFGTYPTGFLQWDLPSVSLASIGVTGQPTNIYGSTISVNGYPIEFIEDSLVPFTVGGVTQGSSFEASSFFNGTSYQNWPIVEVLRKILYPYIPPVLALSIDVNSTGNSYAEVGTTASLALNYSIQHFSREAAEDVYNFLITTTSSFVNGTTYSGIPALAFTGSVPGSIFTGTALTSTYSSTTGQVISYHSFVSTVNGATPVIFPLGASGAFANGFSFSTSTSFKFVSPIVAGFVTADIVNFNIMTSGANDTRDNTAALVYGQTVSVNKVILPYPGPSQSISIGATGYGYLYFLVPSTSNYNYGTLSMIKDPNGFIVHDIQALTYSAFTYSPSILPSTPYDYYSDYKIYRTSLTCSYYGIGKFQLTFT